MADALRNFDKRARAVETTHKKLAQGYVTKLGRDGVMRHKPKVRLSFISPRAIVYLALVFTAFKGFLLSNLGEATYTAHLADLGQGGFVDRAGGFLMGVDPATAWIANALTVIL
ncbi:hypothetical protein VK792_00195 [Mesobacterium sp. TK19101]|uniref:Uncharacterized protein n=1 Tax=Mesobacterium hydrothermale TaxID=3111907 RepID=A0ABU6HCH8_9RHOB|nr:hypothetical protein [Mesobacterium sp. TK19101]MEC3859686.1 hypothetical protein [Mesobacterium sp. TK19101]